MQWKIFLLFFLSFFFIFGIYFFIFEFPKIKVLKEVSALTSDEKILSSIKSKKCKNVLKKENVWIVNECEDNVYFTFFFKNDKNFTLGYCFDSQNPREIFLKVKEFFPGYDCLNIGKKDVEITTEVLKKIGLKSYDLCGGRQVLFKENCVIGVK